MSQGTVRGLHRLSAGEVKTRTEGMHADGGGLYLRVGKSKLSDENGVALKPRAAGALGGANVKPPFPSSRAWVFIYNRSIAGKTKRTELGLGAYPAVSLDAARKRAKEIRDQLQAGKDPKAEKTAAKGIPTLAETLEQYAATFGPSRAETTVRRWRSIIRLYGKGLAGLRINAIQTEHVRMAMMPLWPRPSAGFLRNMVETLWDFARVKYSLPDVPNPARWSGHLEMIMPNSTHKAKHYAAMPFEQLPEFFARLSVKDSNVARLLAFQILTATRPSEPRLMTWEEVDLDTGVWTISAERTKKRREHRVPLCETTLQIIAFQRRLTNGPYVFPGQGRSYSGHISHFGAAQLMASLDAGKFTPHGFRSSFRDYMSEQCNYPTELLERCLAHVTADATERAYARSDLLERRRPIMNAWDLYLRGVVRLHIVASQHVTEGVALAS